MEARGISQPQLSESQRQLSESQLSALQRAEPVWQAALRRLADIVVAGTALVLTAPILIVVALAIRVDSPGPAIFRQRRVGRGEDEFTLLKFRSMRVDADPKLHRDYVAALIHDCDRGPAPVNGDGLYKLAVDNRITAVGRLIRKWSLDELPQLLNVLGGDMSLVGPRPVIPYEVAEYPLWYRQRFAVKPGLTGLWQVSGRNQRTYEEMVRLDIEYADRRSLLLDLSILLRTPWTLLSRKGAA